MKQVILLTGNALCNNPRARKEAQALADAGFKVTVLGAWMSIEAKQRDRELLAGAPYAYEAVLDVADASAPGKVATLLARVRTGASRKLHEFLGTESRWQLGYTIDRLLNRARRSYADLYIAHSEAGLFAARELQRAGRRIGVDMEDWFSEDLPPESRRGRPVYLLKALEQDVLRLAAHATCTSAAMAKALAERYGCAEPRVVYNAFPWADRRRLDGLWKDRPRNVRPSIHWYSQTLGPGRGLEDLMDALQWITASVDIHLRGQSAPAYREHLLARLAPPKRERLHFHDPVPGTELLSRIAEHDIGFVGELPSVPSRNLTVTNKLMEYLLAGLGVVASSTSGQQEIAAAAAGAILIYPSGRPRELSSQVNVLLDSPDRLLAARRAALQCAEAAYCWEKQAPTFLDSVDSAIRDSTGVRQAGAHGYR